MATQTFDDVAVQLFNMTLECIHSRAMATGHLTYRDVTVLHFWFVSEQLSSNRVLFQEIMGNATPGINTRDTDMLIYWNDLEALVD